MTHSAGGTFSDGFCNGSQMQWTAQVAVQRVAARSDDVAHEQSYVVRVRALGATGWGEWSPRSAQLQPQVLLPENPLKEDEDGRRGGGGRSGRSSRGR